MGSVMNGMSLSGGIIPYGATFLIFLITCVRRSELESFMGAT